MSSEARRLELAQCWAMQSTDSLLLTFVSAIVFCLSGLILCSTKKKKKTPHNPGPRLKTASTDRKYQRRNKSWDDQVCTTKSPNDPDYKTLPDDDKCFDPVQENDSDEDENEYEEDSESVAAAHHAKKPPPAASKRPSAKLADAHDPQYQTLANLDNQVFDHPANQQSRDRPKVVDALDPQYQTLANLDNEVFDDRKQYGGAAGGGGGAARQPAVAPAMRRPGGVVDAYDPQYQTLANLDNNIFEHKNNNPKGGGAPPGNKVVDAYDPQYQTLANLDNQVFDQKPGGAAKGKPRVADAADPQYQTLANLDNRIFEQKRQPMPNNATHPPYFGGPGARGGGAPFNPLYRQQAGPAAHNNNQYMGGAANRPRQSPWAIKSGPQQQQRARPVKVVQATDPQYQTLANLDNEVFDKKRRY